MDEKLYNTNDVNPAVIKSRVIRLFNDIYDMINEKDNPNDTEMLIQARLNSSGID